ncbi:MAG: hypothetical protein DCC57_00450 [Chloroflexi bacterium]|nr:MAG: hypothetical protein DCC57_00450 [Chloroflexota bacterium]
MALAFWKTKPAAPAPPARDPVALSQRAVECLQNAVQVQIENPDLFVEERVVWQPDSWLLQRIWQALADGGAGEAALAVAALVEDRAPLARQQALYRLAQQTERRSDLRILVRRELQQARLRLFGVYAPSEANRLLDHLLLTGAAAAHAGESALALACLERADQLAHTWDRVMGSAEQRGLLAEILAQVGLHPLTNQIVTQAIRRYEDVGAQFLHQVLNLIGARLAGGPLPRGMQRLLRRCVESFQAATFTNLGSRRLAAAAFGRMGRVADVLDQLTIIANVQEARRDSGLSGGKDDPHFLRQVKRPTANADVDFQVYTLQEAIRAMPVRAIAREERIQLADRLASLAIRSDGWTAAGAAASLIELGALRYAVSVVDHIPPQDPTRSEGVISLVRALLDVGETRLAGEQVQKALAWLKALDRRNPERATIWGLAEVYLDHHQPEMALHLLDQRQAAPTLGDRMRRTFQSRMTDDELRDNRLRFQALLRQPEGWGRDLQALYDQLCQWTPRLLDGEALISFYLDGMLRPLLAAGRLEHVWTLLPQVREALTASSGDKHTMQVQRVATLLAEQAAPRLMAPPQAAPAGNGADADPIQTHAHLADFVLELWRADVQKGLWQTIHGVEGSLPLLLALEGPEALLAVAHRVAQDGSRWADEAQEQRTGTEDSARLMPRPAAQGVPRS